MECVVFPPRLPAVFLARPQTSEQKEEIYHEKGMFYLNRKPPKPLLAAEALGMSSRPLEEVRSVVW